MIPDRQNGQRTVHVVLSTGVERRLETLGGKAAGHLSQRREPLLETMRSECPHRNRQKPPHGTHAQPECWTTHRCLSQKIISSRSARRRRLSDSQVTTRVNDGGRARSSTIARASAARKSEPVTQISPSESVSLAASASAPAGSAREMCTFGRSVPGSDRRSTSGGTDRGFSTYRVAMIVSKQGRSALSWPARSLSRVVPKTSVRRDGGKHVRSVRPGRSPRRRCGHRRSPARASGRPPRPAPATGARRNLSQRLRA